jgi:hypothetical protein
MQILHELFVAIFLISLLAQMMKLLKSLRAGEIIQNDGKLR